LERQELASAPALALPLRPVRKAPLLRTRKNQTLKGVLPWQQHAISVAKAPALVTTFHTHR